MYSVAGYRANPMARAIIDTYTSFCVGDSGVSLQVTNPQVEVVANEFWNDPRVKLGGLQEILLRDMLLNGETLWELMVGTMSGVTRFCPLDPSIITDVTLEKNNPLWPDKVTFREAGEDRFRRVAHVDDSLGLRQGQAMFWTPFKTLVTDKRSMPFLSPVLDWLTSYDTVLSNLVDRTALARYLVWCVKVRGGQKEVDAFVNDRGGLHAPRSGSVEVHNDSVEWEAKTAQTGAYEDSKAAASVLTQIAGGSGLSKVWLAEPEDANRATSLSMAEPVRRRVQGVQKVWLDYQAEMVRFAVDQAVLARRLPRTVQAVHPKSNQAFAIPASQSVLVTGPEIAAADAQITAGVLINLATALEKFQQIGALSEEAARLAARKGWEDFVGVPYRAELDSPEANPDDVATHVDDKKSRLQAVT